MKKIARKLTLPSFLLFAGLGCFILATWLPNYSTAVVVAGELVWGATYFLIVKKNYQKKGDLPTRGGMISYKENPWKYKFSYAIMYCIGGIILLVFLCITVFPA